MMIEVQVQVRKTTATFATRSCDPSTLFFSSGRHAVSGQTAGRSCLLGCAWASLERACRLWRPRHLASLAWPKSGHASDCRLRPSFFRKWKLVPVMCPSSSCEVGRNPAQLWLRAELIGDAYNVPVCACHCPPKDIFSRSPSFFA
jgi:hypothetical protein